MLCAVHLLDGTTENVALEKHAEGICLLEEVCRRSKLIPEMDYFGLRFVNKLGQEQWLNLRNQIRSQMSKSQIYHLHLRVKYFVKQSQLFLQETKNQFFLDVKQNLSQGKYMLSRDKCSRFATLSLRSEHGEDALSKISKYPLVIRDWNPQVDIEALDRLRSEHARLKGVSGIRAKEMLLSEMENEENTYGAEIFSAINCLKERVLIAVCLDALRIYDNHHGLIDKYRYGKGLYPSVKGNNFIVEIEENYRCYKITYKLNNTTSAQILYRTTVEFCTFFTQEKVYDWVLDSKKTRKHLRTLGPFFRRRRKSARKQEKLYDFDILRTSSEAFSKAWRLIAEEKAKSIQIACGLYTPKIREQKTFKFGPDTPKSGTSKLAFDFSRPASQLRSRSGYLTPTLAPNVTDTPASPKTPRLLPVPGTSLSLGVPLPGMTRKQTTFLSMSRIESVPCAVLHSSMTPTPAVSMTSLTDETNQQSRTEASSGSTAQESIQDIVTKLRSTSLAQKEKKTFQDRFLCRFCRKAYKNCSFDPCGHVVTCVNCALKCDKCIECQADVESTTPIRYP